MHDRLAVAPCGVVAGGEGGERIGNFVSRHQVPRVPLFGQPRSKSSNYHSGTVWVPDNYYATTRRAHLKRIRLSRERVRACVRRVYAVWDGVERARSGFCRIPRYSKLCCTRPHRDACVRIRGRHPRVREWAPVNVWRMPARVSVCVCAPVIRV